MAISDQTTNFTNVAADNLAASVSSTLGISVTSLIVRGGVYASGVTLDLRTNAVKPSSVTYGVNPGGWVIGQWGFVQNASGFSMAFSSGASIYFFGGSTLSAAQA